MKVLKSVIKYYNGRKYITVEILDCRYKTFNGAAKLMDKYIGSGRVAAYTAFPAAEDPKNFEYHGNNGTYVFRRGNLVRVNVYDKIGLCYSLHFNVDCDGNICYMSAMQEIRKINM